MDRILLRKIACIAAVTIIIANATICGCEIPDRGQRARRNRSGEHTAQEALGVNRCQVLDEREGQHGGAEPKQTDQKDGTTSVPVGHMSPCRSKEKESQCVEASQQPG